MTSLKEIYSCKKSQITVYIIIGILIILLLIAYLFISSSRNDLSGDQIMSGDLNTISDPVQRYVTECLKLTAYDAIHQMGEHGGFVEFDRHGITYDPTDPTNSQAVVFSLGGSTEAATDFFAIPYYWYMEDTSGCTEECVFITQFPELHRGESVPTIEEELDYYINNNLGKCINSFSDMKKRGYNITELGLPVVTSSVNDETMSFVLSYPLKIQQQKNHYTLEEYYTEHDINFKEIYGLALEITALQARDRFLERQATNLVTGYASLDGEIPPIADMTFDFGSPGEIWVKTDVENTVQDILAKYVPALRAVGTNNYVNIGVNPFSEKILDYQMRIELNRSYDLDAYFTYLPMWEPYFNLDYCDGEICKADSWSNTMLLLIGFQRYQFYYTFSYPVLVKVHDEKAFNGEGFDFHFFLESNVRDNDVLYPGGNASGGGLAGGSSLLCNSNQRNSGNFTLTAIDDLTEKKVKDAFLYFTCGYESCFIDILENGTFNGSLPICAGGVLSLIKEGYLTNASLLSTKVDEGIDVGDMRLQPYRRINVSINKIKFTKPTTGNTTNTSAWIKSGEGALKQNQEATIILTKNLAGGQNDLVQVATVNNENQSSEMELVPGVYEVEIILLDRNTIVIPEEEREIEIIGSLYTQDYTMPRFEFNESTPWLLGGLSGNFTLTENIDTANSIVINVVAFEMGEILPETRRQIEDLEVISLVSNYTDNYKSQLGFRYR